MCEIIIKIPTKIVTNIETSVKFPKYFLRDYSGDYSETIVYTEFKVLPEDKVLRTSLKYSDSYRAEETSWEIEKCIYTHDSLSFNWGNLFSTEIDSSYVEISEQDYRDELAKFKEFLDHGV